MYVHTHRRQDTLGHKRGMEFILYHKHQQFKFYVDNLLLYSRSKLVNITKARGSIAEKPNEKKEPTLVTRKETFVLCIFIYFFSLPLFHKTTQ